MRAIKFLKSKSDCILMLSFAAICWATLLWSLMGKL